MDTQKIGKFLAELRKENSMTQEQLGEKIGVTNKTISRWENGNYMPPIECLTLLSDLYQISINEIVAGKRLEENDFMSAAEQNISTVIKETQEQNKHFERNLRLIMLVTTVFAMAAILLLPGGSNLTATDKIKEIIVIVLVVGMAMISNALNLVALLLSKKES